MADFWLIFLGGMGKGPKTDIGGGCSPPSLTARELAQGNGPPTLSKGRGPVRSLPWFRPPAATKGHCKPTNAHGLHLPRGHRQGHNNTKTN